MLAQELYSIKTQAGDGEGYARVLHWIDVKSQVRVSEIPLKQVELCEEKKRLIIKVSARAQSPSARQFIQEIRAWSKIIGFPDTKI